MFDVMEILFQQVTHFKTFTSVCVVMLSHVWSCLILLFLFAVKRKMSSLMRHLVKKVKVAHWC